MTFASEMASMIRLVIVVLPEPVPPHMPMTRGRMSSGRIARLRYFLRFPFFLSSITAWAAARRAIGTQNGVALT
jgi:hypothetical protein